MKLIYKYSTPEPIRLLMTSIFFKSPPIFFNELNISLLLYI